MKKHNRFRISHLFLSVFLLGFGFAIGYWMISSWVFFYFDWKMIFMIPTFIIFSVFPFVCGICLIVSDIKSFFTGENNSFYEDK